MLIQLSIRNIVLIEQLDLEFSGGLSVLTGETGAGKSILLDSLSLALGGRGDGSLVRKGEPEGSVTAVFDLEQTHPLHKFLLENGVAGDEDLILRRVQKADGKTRAFVNDSPVSASLLREIGQRLVEIHGQHDDRAMLDAASHRGLLDAYGGLEADAGLTAGAWQAWQGSENELEKLRQQVDEARREADYLRASCDELKVLAPEPGEEADLAEARAEQARQEAERMRRRVEAGELSPFSMTVGASGE